MAESKEEKPSSRNTQAFIRILYGLASIDNEVDDEEWRFLKKVAKRWGITEKEFEDIFDKGEKLDYMVPENEDEKMDQFAALIGMMMVDGKIFDEEFQFCSVMARKMGFTDDTINEIVADIMEKR